jgi:hypothetical protein
MLCGRPGSSHLGVWRLSRALMVSVTPHRSLHKFTLVRDYLSCTIEYPHLASGLATLIPPPTRTGLPLTRRMPGSSRKTGAHQAQVSLFRPKAELWKKSGRRSEQAGYRPRAHTMLAPPGRFLRTVIPARQRDLHRKVLVRAQADRNSHARFHQWFQSMKRSPCRLARTSCYRG